MNKQKFKQELEKIIEMEKHRKEVSKDWTKGNQKGYVIALEMVRDHLLKGRY